MIDLRLLRNEFASTAEALARRGVHETDLTSIAELDASSRAVSSRRDDLRRQINELSKSVGVAHREKNQSLAEELADKSRELGEQESLLADEARGMAERLREALLLIPNLPSVDAPEGSGEEDNVDIRRHGDPARYDSFIRPPHWEIGEELGILDMARGAKISGSMFPMYRGAGAQLARALVQFGLDLNRDAFEEIRPPTLVRTDTMVATGHLPKFHEEAYAVERDDLWAIPTAEVPLTSLGRDEVFGEAELPLRVMAHTSCYRREAGAAGRDNRGLLRVHEFDKVEILAYCTPSQAQEVHADLVARAERALVELDLTYRVLDLCAGDLGASSARTFDLEVWAPGVQNWLEVSSISWFSDYQARRANIRYKGDAGPVILHTLNGSALAVPRVWAAVVEANYQNDGSVVIPEVLRGYMGGLRAIEPRG